MCISLDLGIFPDDAGDGGDAPTIFPPDQSPIPLCAGMKYPVWESLTSIIWKLPWNDSGVILEILEIGSESLFNVKVDVLSDFSI